MRIQRPYVLSIAGYDPSGGAGILADIKTFEANKTYGLGVISANTFQNDREFISLDWMPLEKISAQLQVLAKRFPVSLIKIGLIQSLEALAQVIAVCRKLWPDCKIIWDPILKASAGFRFHAEINKTQLQKVLREIFLVTPNMPEAQHLAGNGSASENAKELSAYCHVLLKGGHAAEKTGYDRLFTHDGKEHSFRPKEKNVSQKHGSGCVLSAALAAQLAKGETLHRACLIAKEYTSRFLKSSETLLGYHKI